MSRFLLFLLAGLLLGLPLSALAAPGDAAPSSGDDDDAPAPSDDDDAPAPSDDDDAPAPSDDDDTGAGDIELPDLGGSRGDATAPPADGGEEEDEEALDERYRVVVPETEPEEAETARPDKARDRSEERTTRESRKPRGLVKVIQQKFFLKYRRVELTPQIGYVGNDDFIRRLSLGLGVGFHINEILALEVLGSYLPDLGETDYKPLTMRFREEVEVVPDISRVVSIGVLNVALSPIYGKVEIGGLRIINYDIYVVAGMGVVLTKDDTAIIRSPCDEHTTRAQRKADTANGCQYVDQTHYVTDFGGGFRIVFNDWIGIRLDARQFTHIEQVYRDDGGQGEIGLEMKQNFLISLGASFFFPPKARTVPL